MTLKLVKWKVSDGARLLDCGSTHAASERVVLDRILQRSLGKFEPRADRSYRIEAGGLTASSYGDEFAAVAEAAELDETKPLVGGHLFAPPSGVLDAIPGAKAYLDEKAAERLLDAKPSCGHASMNRDVWRGPNKHAGCDDCDYVHPVPVMTRPLSAEELQSQADAEDDGDSDRAREAREVLHEIGRTITRTLIGRAMETVLGRAPAGGLDLGGGDVLSSEAVEDLKRQMMGPWPGTRTGRMSATRPNPSNGPKKEPCAPADHRVVARRDERMASTYYHCLVCEKAYALNDQQMVLGDFPGGVERAVREVLSS